MDLVFYIFATALCATLCLRNATWTCVKSDERLHLRRINTGFLILFWGVFSVLMGFRYGFVDTGVYKRIVGFLGTNVDNMFDLSHMGGIEIGFRLWMLLCNIVSGSNAQFFVLVTTAFTLAGVFVFIKRESIDVGFSIFLFITLYSFTFMNGIRQAWCVPFFSLAYIKYRDRPIVIALVCVFLSFFHKSILFMFVLYLCSHGRFFNAKIKAFFCCCLLVAAFPGVTNVLTVILPEKYSESLVELSAGTGIMRILINSFPAVMIFIARGRKEKWSAQFDGIDNLFLIDLAINFSSLRSTYFARFFMYFALFLCAYYPVIMRRGFNQVTPGFATFLLTVFYAAFYFFQAATFERYGYLRQFYLNW